MNRKSSKKNTRNNNQPKRNRTRKRLGKRTFIHVLNNDFQEMMRQRGDPGKHLFFQSNRWFKSKYAEWAAEEWKLKKASNKIPYISHVDLSTLVPDPDCKFIPKKTLTPAYLNAFYKQLTTTNDYDAIRKKCHDMTNYAMPSPGTNWKIFDGNAINVLILGTGPVGLYTALYLNHIYNKDTESMTEFSFRKINILLVDNRIHKKGEKMPYSRSTQFGFSIEELQPFLQQIFCWNMKKYEVRAFDYIHVLENLLYTVAYHKKIPMTFTKRFDNVAKLNKFIAKESVHVVFDCTGGRTSIPVSHPVRWNQYSFKEGTQEVKLNPDTKYFEFCEDGTVFTTPVFRLQLFGKEHQEILVGNEFAEPTDAKDIALLNQFNNICLRTADYRTLASALQKTDCRDLLPHMLDTINMEEKDIETVKVVVFNTIARHSPFAAASYEGAVLIRLGDSLGGTEYGIVFGMKHSIEFSKHICQLLSTFL